MAPWRLGADATQIHTHTRVCVMYMTVCVSPIEVIVSLPRHSRVLLRKGEENERGARTISRLSLCVISPLYFWVSFVVCQQLTISHTHSKVAHWDNYRWWHLNCVRSFKSSKMFHFVMLRERERNTLAHCKWLPTYKTIFSGCQCVCVCSHFVVLTRASLYLCVCVCDKTWQESSVSLPTCEQVIVIVADYYYCSFWHTHTLMDRGSISVAYNVPLTRRERSWVKETI